MARFVVHALRTRLSLKIFLGSFIPINTLAFIINFSELISNFAPDVTLDFILQWYMGFSNGTKAEKITCLQYVSPWIRNLGIFTDPSSGHFDEPRVRECICLFINMTTQEPEVIGFQKVPGLH